MQSWAPTIEKVSKNRQRKSTTNIRQPRRSTTRNQQQPPTEWHLSTDTWQPTTDNYHWQTHHWHQTTDSQQPLQAFFATTLKPITTVRQHHYVYLIDKSGINAYKLFLLDNNKQTRPLFVSTDWQSKTDDVDLQISCRTCRIVADSAQLCTHVCSYSVRTNSSPHRRLYQPG